MVSQNNKKLARIAGIFYLIVVLTGIFSLAYVPSKLIDFDNATKTVKNIADHNFLFRLSILSGIICYLAFLILPLVLYKLLSHIGTTYAKLMVVLAVISVPISLVNLQNKLAVLSLIDNSNFSFTETQLQQQVMYSLKLYDNGILILQIFWGLWLLPFGYLVYKSSILPKVLGMFLMLGCFGYLINFTGFFLIPNYSEMGISTFVRLPASIGEMGICFWLLIMGAKNTVTHSIVKHE